MKPMTPANANTAARAGHMFQPHSTVSRPSRMPADAVMTPADRSNSPPIISSATATEGIPIVDATSSHRAAPDTSAN